MKKLKTIVNVEEAKSAAWNSFLPVLEKVQKEHEEKIKKLWEDHKYNLEKLNTCLNIKKYHFAKKGV